MGLFDGLDVGDKVGSEVGSGHAGLPVVEAMTRLEQKYWIPDRLNVFGT